ncbi:MAG: cytochrome C biosynthesis protein [Muribaculaceae bacterium]|nr:cytochrome C biosynthesis protein [Muribaculaceae bacterium]
MNNRHIFNIFLLALASMLPVGCGTRAIEPSASSDEVPILNPDYAGVTFPVNIAAPSFHIAGDSTVTEYQTEVGRFGQPASIVVRSESDAVELPLSKWHRLLEESAGDSIYFRIAMRDCNGTWTSAPDIVCPVSEHPIDRYLAYRLLYPGYELWHEMGVYQRDLTSYEQTPILENHEFSNQCVNCHNFSANDPQRGMMVHVRGAQGGTLISKDGAVEKINSRIEGLDHGATYPGWSRDGRHIAFSANNVSQVFHSTGRKPIEVVDMGADLLVYDTQTHRAFTDSIICGEHHLETFPTWTPDGTRLYFCRAEGMREGMALDSVRYDLYRIDFDAATGRFSNLQPVYEASADTASVSFPRVSPDGRWLMFTLSHYGNFSIWHPEAQLCLMDLHSGEWHVLGPEVNSDDIESYHSWSSDGRWFVFSSKRLDGLWARPFIASFDPATGAVGKAFPVPQESADYYRLFSRTYNIPELITSPVTNADALLDGIVGQQACPVTLIKN